MPTALIGSLSLLIFSAGAPMALITPLATGLVYGGLAAGAYALSGLLNQTSVPEPEDGAFNLRQPVPSLAYVLGRVKKGSDYVFLEQANGDAYHILVWAGHRIEGFVTHYAHDEALTLDGSGNVTVPDHFVRGSQHYVNIKERLGNNAATAYSSVVSAFPTIWTNDHRGDGLATVCMFCSHVAAKNFQSVYPHSMPQHSAIGDGMRLYDPRDASTAFSTNIALMRFWHLTDPVGGKLTTADMYLPDWQNAADVCDEVVLNKAGASESRYHGGFWFRAENNPVEVGRIMDQAAELVVYERPDGTIGVHAGEYVAPTIRLTADDIIQCQLDVNQRQASTVLAVRGQYTNPLNRYATADAAIVGDPYAGSDTEQTMTLENAAVQSHNHMQRLQTLAFKRRNAPRVSILAHYEPAKDVPYKRFVKVHLPPKMNEAVVEITSSPKLSLRNLTMEFSGIVLPGGFYSFDAATEEGDPPPVVVMLADDEVPVPTGFDVTIMSESVGGATPLAYGLATWTYVDDEYIYELEYKATSGSDLTPKSVFSNPTDVDLRSGYLKDGQEYKFRLRTWAFGAPSAWTSYITLTAYADPTPPLTLRAFTQTSTAPNLGYLGLQFKTRNDAHLSYVKLYRRPQGAAFDPTTHSAFDTVYVTPYATYDYDDGDSTRTMLISNNYFATDTVWTKGTGWTISGGAASKAAGSASSLSQAMSMTAGQVYRMFATCTRTAGSVALTLQGGTLVSGASISATGDIFEALTAVSGNVNVAAFGTSAFVGTIDNFFAYQQSASCAPAGRWDYYAVPFNASGLAGPESALTNIVVV